MRVFLRRFAFVLWLAAELPSHAQGVRSAALPESAEEIGGVHDPSQSAALFVGVRRFTHDPDLTEVRYAVDDAIDLAYEVALGRTPSLVIPQRVALALSGDPRKAESQQRLEALRAAGAEIKPAEQPDILSLLDRQSRRAGRNGIFIVGIATHGFSVDGEPFALASSSLLQHHETAVSISKIFDIVTTSDASRSLILLDTCRSRISARARATTADPDSAAPLLTALGKAHGNATFYAAAQGSFAFDDDERKNGVFTAAMLDGLRCAADTDARGLITVESLADFVNQRVLTWVRKHKDGAVKAGIQVTTDQDGRAMPLAVCGSDSSSMALQITRVMAQLQALIAHMDTISRMDVARVEKEGNGFQVFNAAGVPLWGGIVRGQLQHAELSDLDGDGKPEIVLAVAGDGADAGHLFVFDAAGRLRWTRDTAGESVYDRSRAGQMAILAMATGDLFRTGKREIVALSIDAEGWYPSRLTIFDYTGKLLASYWHPGHMHRLVIGAPTDSADPRIIVAAVNNDLRGPLKMDGYVDAVFALDPKHVAGEAPPYAAGIQRGTELWYGIILPARQIIDRLNIVEQNGRREISVWCRSGNVFYLDFDGHPRQHALSDGVSKEASYYLVERKK
ncbi:MAG: caspase family protein [Thermoanaerobaculia bacterium]